MKAAPDRTSTLRLPPEVRSAALATLGARTLRGEFAWMSWAGTVWRLAGETGAVYVKRAAHLEDERDRTIWLAGRLPVPEVIGFFHAFGDDWLLTREVSGVPLYHASIGWEPARVARRFGEILREIHATDATGCPFGEAKAGRVLIHGDYCLPNVLVEEGRLTALVDLGQSGLGDPRDDLAAGLWTLHYNFGHGFAREFLDAYGVPSMTDREIERLRRRYGKPHTGKTVSTARQQYQAATDR
ncbi:MAG TPA: phosphotransferase [Candidatus Dormibacteraeota bacterium]|nr:phosphotransferase [Candidatus Dormibacteraeota bacterium]